MAHRIAVCMLNEDLEGFANAMEALKEENDYSASPALAQDFYYSREDTPDSDLGLPCLADDK